ncbi:MAG: hypothetical protein JRH01_12935 [Deltaproteobacteria bacterium]|nr:hypothetical protein [Deltaproteobacteria bacterium]MBW2396291.1 hypothetical protein [Deltaproteobacteria bacterium]
MSKPVRAYDDFASIVPGIEGIDLERAWQMVEAEFDLYGERTQKKRCESAPAST